MFLVVFFFSSCLPLPLRHGLDLNLDDGVLALFPFEPWPATWHMLINALVFPQSSSHAGGDQELVSRMKSLELENQTLHKGVFVCVLSFFMSLSFCLLGHSNLTFLMCLLVSGGGNESSPAEAGVQSGGAGKVPCTCSRLTCTGRRLRLYLTYTRSNNILYERCLKEARQPCLWTSFEYVINFAACFKTFICFCYFVVCYIYDFTTLNCFVLGEDCIGSLASFPLCSYLFMLYYCMSFTLLF